MRRPLFLISLTLLIMVLSAGRAWAQSPLPFTSYGEVTVDEAAVPDGTQVTAWCGGVQYASEAAHSVGANSVYIIIVPGDHQGTTEKEGCQIGEIVRFKIGNLWAEQTFSWSPETTANIDLSTHEFCYSLTVVESPVGGGTVTKSPAPNCGNRYAADTTVRLTANANAGFAFRNWSDDADGADNPITLTMSGDKKITAHFTPDSGNQVFMPGILAVAQPKPDLVVQEIVVTANTVRVIISNQGSAPVPQHNGFWVDVYIDPKPLPSKANEIWPILSEEGLVWGVDGSALPMDPGDTITLNIGDNLYWPTRSSFSGSLAAGTRIYAQVDSANTNTTYGRILETHEADGGAYNNILGSVVVTATALERALYLPFITDPSLSTSTTSTVEQKVGQTTLPQ